MMHEAPSNDAYKADTVFSRKVPERKEDTEEVAGFLLSLKRRDSISSEADLKTDDRNYNHIPTAMRPLYTQPYKIAPPMHMEIQRSMVMKNSPSIPAAINAAAEMPWETLLANSNLISIKDRDLVSDALLVAMAQMRPCRLTAVDKVGCYKTRQLGFLGFCCKNCGGQPGFGRYFPNTVRSLAQTTTSQTILKHVAGKCQCTPVHIRNTIVSLQNLQSSKEQGNAMSGRPRYGSRKIFFQRVWSRLHGTGVHDEYKEPGNYISTLNNPNCLDTEVCTSSSGDSADTVEYQSLKSKRKNRFGSPPTKRNKPTKAVQYQLSSN